jgi:hypothetical protein
MDLPQPLDPDPDDQATDHLNPWSADDLQDDPEELELGTPVYEGTGLSVRALTAEELERFLQAHAGQPARLLGSGWEALRPPAQPTGGPLRGSPDPLGWQAPLPAGPGLAPRGGYGSPGRSALQTYRQQRAAELAGWARTAGWRAAAITAAGVPPHSWCRRATWTGWRCRLGWPPRRWSAGGWGSASPATPARSATAPGASGPPPACSASGTGTAGPG